MCLILVAYRVVPDVPLLVLANRDEVTARPAAAAAFWKDAPGVFAGRDLEKGGTWLGTTRDGRLACVTNVRDPAARREGLSRGALVAGFLTESGVSARTYVASVSASAYPGHNALFFDGDALVYANDEGVVTELTAGIHGLSNARIDTPWPKVVAGKQALEALVSRGAPLEDGFAVLASRGLANDAALPSTGVPLSIERALSSAFIHALLPTYGTRCSTVVKVGQTETEVIERTYDSEGEVSGEVRERFWISPCNSPGFKAP